MPGPTRGLQVTESNAPDWGEVSNLKNSAPETSGSVDLRETRQAATAVKGHEQKRGVAKCRPIRRLRHSLDRPALIGPNRPASHRPQYNIERISWSSSVRVTCPRQNDSSPRTTVWMMRYRCLVVRTRPSIRQSLIAMRLGEARQKYVRQHRRLRFAPLVRISPLTAAAMALVGTVRFIGPDRQTIS